MLEANDVADSPLRRSVCWGYMRILVCHPWRKGNRADKLVLCAVTRYCPSVFMCLLWVVSSFGMNTADSLELSP
jgi:hypothetical protein